MNDYHVRISKKLSYYLRHGLEKHNIPHDSEGFVNLYSLLEVDENLNNVTIDTIQNIVNNDSKKRLELKTTDNIIYIRANQGHSSGKLNDNKMLELIEKPIERCFHGTYKKHLFSIKKNGLSRMSRKHIHIAETEDAVSGQRKDCNLKIYINMQLAMQDGIEFYRSSNGVILTPGNSDGLLLPKYLIF